MKSNLFLLPDINECILAVSGCSQLCLNTIGGFKCDCITGYELTADNVTCAGEAQKSSELLLRLSAMYFRNVIRSHSMDSIIILIMS